MDGSRALAAVDIPPRQIHIQIDVDDPLLGRLVRAADAGRVMRWALVVVGVLVQQVWAFRWLVAATAGGHLGSSGLALREVIDRVHPGAIRLGVLLPESGIAEDSAPFLAGRHGVESEFVRCYVRGTPDVVEWVVLPEHGSLSLHAQTTDPGRNAPIANLMPYISNNGT